MPLKPVREATDPGYPDIEEFRRSEGAERVRATAASAHSAATHASAGPGPALGRLGLVAGLILAGPVLAGCDGGQASRMPGAPEVITVPGGAPRGNGAQPGEPDGRLAGIIVPPTRDGTVTNPEPAPFERLPGEVKAPEPPQTPAEDAPKRPCETPPSPPAPPPEGPQKPPEESPPPPPPPPPPERPGGRVVQPAPIHPFDE